MREVTLLDVDLTSGTIKPVIVPPDVARTWLGGTGLGLRLLATYLRPGMRTADPECPVLVMPGPLTGTAIPQSSNWTIVTVNSDLPQHVCASQIHGWFGARLRHAGWDGVVLRNRAAAPVYLLIDDDKVSLESAHGIWGTDTYTTQSTLVQRHGTEQDTSVACIGQGGEHLVEGATVRSDIAFSASQGGAGLAFGSKNLKAIVVRGTHPAPLHDPDLMTRTAEAWKKKLYESIPGFPQSRYFSGLKNYTTKRAGPRGWVPGKNFTDPAFGATWAENAGIALQSWKLEPVGSWNCEAMCHFRATCTTGPAAGMKTSGFGGEAWEGCGPNLGITDVGVTMGITAMCDGYGVAAHSLPGTIAMLMEAYEARDITKDDLDGIELRWGDEAAVMELLERSVNREGVGDIIANGLRETARHFGIEDRAVHMHGMGFNTHDQRAVPMWLFQSQIASGAGPTWQSAVTLPAGFGVEPDLGIRTIQDPRDLSRIAEMTFTTQQKKLWVDSLGMCMFATAGFEGMFELGTDALNAATGRNYTVEEALLTGQRIVNLQRLITLYLGYRVEDDLDISSRLLKKLGEGPAEGVGMTRDELIQARDAFYRMQEWSLTTGAPSDDLLSRLGMADLRVGHAALS